MRKTKKQRRLDAIAQGTTAFLKHQPPESCPYPLAPYPPLTPLPYGLARFWLKGYYGAQAFAAWVRATQPADPQKDPTP
jgi:hypothetical protein